ncbi:MAG: hypothetical protein SGPRY_005503 [Prymnesium sp.]
MRTVSRVEIPKPTWYAGEGVLNNTYHYVTPTGPKISEIIAARKKAKEEQAAEQERLRQEAQNAGQQVPGRPDSDREYGENFDGTDNTAAGGGALTDDGEATNALDEEENVKKPDQDRSSSASGVSTSHSSVRKAFGSVQDLERLRSGDRSID